MRTYQSIQADKSNKENQKVLLYIWEPYKNQFSFMAAEEFAEGADVNAGC